MTENQKSTDGTLLHPTSGHRPDPIEIIGFQGTPLMPCGRRSAIGRDVATGRCFDLTGYQPGRFRPHTTYTSAEISQYVAAAQITLFRRPQKLHADPVVLYVTSEMLAALKDDPGKIETALEPLLPGVWAVCDSEPEIQDILNGWAYQLLSYADEHLRAHLANKDEQARQEAERYADLARSAACDTELLWQVYQRLVLSMEWVRARNVRTFEVEPTFPDRSLEDFRQKVNELRAALKQGQNVIPAPSARSGVKPRLPEEDDSRAVTSAVLRNGYR